MKKVKLFLDKKKKILSENLKKINKLSLKERKQQVIKELENESLNLEFLEYLLLMDNTNEDLLYKYIDSTDKNNVHKEIMKFCYYMSCSKIEKLKCKFFQDKNMGYKGISNKDSFFSLLSAIETNNKIKIDEQVSKIKIIENSREENNQPFDIKSNIEAFYLHILTLLLSKMITEKNRKDTDYDKYLKFLKTYVCSLEKELAKYKSGEIDETKDLKKFYTIIFSIINFDETNKKQITHLSNILQEQDKERIEKRLSLEIDEIIKDSLGEIDEKYFEEIIANKNVFYSIKDITFENNKIQIPEKCYLYNYIINHNVFKKYEDKIISLLNIIYKSDLFKNLVRIIYNTEDNVNKYYFEENNFVKDFWDNDIIFVPFKLKKVSGFSYKDSFKIFFCIYKIRHFDYEIENEIFTLGAFIRVLIHESFGHLIIANIFYMFYANINKINNYLTPKITSQMENIDKKHLEEYIGKHLSTSICDYLNQIDQRNIENEKRFMR